MFFAFWNIRMRATTDGYLSPCCWRKTKWKEAKRIIAKLIELKKKKKRMLSKLTAVISTEIQEQLEVFLPHHIYEERIKGWKEPSLSMPLPRGCAPGSPAVPAPCTDSGWGLWRAAGETCSEQSYSRATCDIPVTELGSPWHSTQHPAWDWRMLSSCDIMQCKAVN